MKYLSLPALLLIFKVSLIFGTGIAWGATSDSHSPALTPPSSLPSGSSTGNVSATSTSSRSANSSISASSTNTAQYPSLTGIPPCATTCFETAISQSNCSSVVDVNCFCVSGKFPKGIVSCISTTCPTLLNTTEQLAQQFCNLASSSSSLSFPTPTTTSTATSGTATATVISSVASTTASSTATQSGAAVGLGWGRGGDGGRMVLIGLGVGVMGLVGGALCV